MKKFEYLSVQQIYNLDRVAEKKFLIPSLILMENAGRETAEFIRKLSKGKTTKVVIFCGPGKNGGDGFVCARYLHIWGFKVNVIVFVPYNRYSGNTLTNYKIIKKLGVNIQKFKYERTKRLISKCDIIVDAIFGIGLSRNVEGVFYDAIQLINSSRKIVVSVDIPSGLDANTGKVLGISVVANYTITMGTLKIGFKPPTAKTYLGKVKVIDIGYPQINFSEL